MSATVSASRPVLSAKSAAQQLASMSPEVRNMYLLAAAKKRKEDSAKHKDKRSVSVPSVLPASSPPSSSTSPSTSPSALPAKISRSGPVSSSSSPPETQAAPSASSPSVDRKKKGKILSLSSDASPSAHRQRSMSTNGPSSSSPSTSSRKASIAPRLGRRPSCNDVNAAAAAASSSSSSTGYDQVLPFLCASKTLGKHLEKEIHFQRALHVKASSKLQTRKKRTDRMRAKRSNINDLPIERLKTLTALLSKSDFAVARTLVAIVHANESSRELCDALMKLFMPTGKALKLVVSALNDEVATCERTTTTLLRTDSVATCLTGSFNRYFCKAFLRHCLRSSAKRVMALGPSSLEVKPGPNTNESDARRNVTEMSRICEKLINRILDSSSQCPPETKKLLQMALAVVEAQGGFQSQGLQVVSSLLFLRLICPAIVTPNLYGVVSGTPSLAQTKTLTILSKVVQNVVNDVRFDEEKEPHMTPFNTLFTAERTAKVVRFVDNLLSSDTFSVEKSFASLTIDRVEKIHLLQLIAKYVLVYASKLSAHISEDNPLRERFENFLPEDVRSRLSADSSSTTETDESLQTDSNSGDSEETNTDFSCDDIWLDASEDSDPSGFISDFFGDDD